MNITIWGMCVWSVTAFQDIPFLSFFTLHFEVRILSEHSTFYLG